MKRILIALGILFGTCAPALAALPCPAYPNTLTNGTLADANQVMANFNNILNCVNGLAPLGVPTVGATGNVRASVASASASVTATADSVTVGTALNGTSYTLTSYSQAFNGATTGAGGMDTGTLPSSTFVALYAIYNPTAPAISILGTSCATSCPTVYAGANMPAGYTASALLTVLPTNATPQFPASVYARGKRVYVPSTSVLSTATAHGSPTSLAISSTVPPDAIEYSGTMNNTCGTTPGNGTMSLAIFPDANGSSAFFQTANNCNSLNGASYAASFTDMAITTTQTMFYSNIVAGTTPTSALSIIGYVIP